MSVLETLDFQPMLIVDMFRPHKGQRIVNLARLRSLEALSPTTASQGFPMLTRSFLADGSLLSTTDQWDKLACNQHPSSLLMT